VCESGEGTNKLREGGRKIVGREVEPGTRVTYCQNLFTEDKRESMVVEAEIMGRQNLEDLNRNSTVEAIG
jgi:hypothetical protein